jgi:PAS domain S-box-containing protein
MTKASLTLLVIEDSPEDRELYRRCLRRDQDHAYTILEASLGGEGLELWRQHQPDVILLDYRLPDFDGLEFLAQLAAESPLPCPVIVTTGYGDETIAVKAMRAGAQDYLVKGQITPEGLKLAIEGALSRIQLQVQLQQRIDRQRLVSEITDKVRQSLELQEILQTTVDEVRQFMQADRVFMYRFQPDFSGVVAVESVHGEFTAILQSQVEDDYFKENFGEDYRQGHIQITEDIYTAGLTRSHIELLEQFQIRANLVMPILQGEALWGLLVVNQCSGPRQWQPLEIELLQDLSAQVGIALQQAELYHQVQTELAQRKQMEAELRRSEERFRTSVENMLDCFGVYTAVRNDQGEIVDFRIEYVNHAACVTNQMSRDDQISHNLLDILPGHWESGLFQEYCQVVETGESLVRDSLIYEDVFGQHRLARAYDIRAAKLGDGFVATWRDITDRKRAEEALALNEARLQGFVDADVVGILQGDIHGNIFKANDELLRMIGYSREELERGELRWLDMTPAEHLPRDQQAIAEARDRGACTPYEKEYIRKDGSRVPVLLGYSLVDEAQEETVVFVLDLSDRKRTEQRLRRSEDRLQMALHAAQLGTWDWKIQADQLVWDARCKAIFGLPAEAEVNLDVFFNCVHPEDREQVNTTIQTLLAPESDSHFEAEFRTVERPDSPSRWVASKGQVYFSARGKPQRFIGTVRDITEEKQAEAEREQLLSREQAARVAAERANRVKDEFLAILSHELRSPLNPILGWTKLLQTRALDENKTHRALETIERNVKLQTQLIDDLLDVARILRGKLKLDVASIDLASVIEAATEVVQTSAEAKSITLRTTIVDHCQTRGDAGRLQQIIWNLLSNAIKFTPSGGRIEVRLEQVAGREQGSAEAREPDGEMLEWRDSPVVNPTTPPPHHPTTLHPSTPQYAQISITDTGKGINPDFLPHIFESFRQEDTSITRQYGGLGLGLSIVKYLVDAHGGTITADSPGEGQGATFTVTLPLLDESRQGTTVTKAATPDLQGIRILAVDDSPDTRDLLQVVLNAYGAEVDIASSAEAALQYLKTTKPNVLVCDIGMPDMDGYRLLQYIRTLPDQQQKPLPAIAVTAYAREEDRRRALEHGFQKHIAKPIEPEILAVTIAELVADATMSAAPHYPKFMV